MNAIDNDSLKMCKPAFQAFVHEQTFNHWRFSHAARDREAEEGPYAADLMSARPAARTQLCADTIEPCSPQSSETSNNDHSSTRSGLRNVRPRFLEPRSWLLDNDAAEKKKTGESSWDAKSALVTHDPKK